MIDFLVNLNYRALILLLIWWDIHNYFLERYVLWSIFHLDNRGKAKYSKTKKIKEGHTFFQRINMFYLLEHIKKHKKEFMFWCKFKSAHFYSEMILILLYGFFAFIIPINQITAIFCLFILLQAFVIWIIMVANTWDKETKYDRMSAELKNN